MRTRSLAPLALASISLALAACTTTEKADVLPQDGPTMKAIYDAHMNRVGATDLDRARQALGERHASPAPGPAGLVGARYSLAGSSRSEASARAVGLAGYTRSAHREIEALFPRLPNPDLVMYVFPHRAGPHGVPVPGYATSFPLYERVEYALPGESPGGGAR